MLSLYPHMSALSHLYLGMVRLGLALLVESLEIDVLIVAETAVCDDVFSRVVLVMDVDIIHKTRNSAEYKVDL